MTLPAVQSAVMNNYGWRGDTSKMFSCSLCQYHTPDEEQIMEHFNSSEHKDILKHLVIFFPQHRLDFLQEYFLYVKEEMSMQQKNSDMPPIRDKFKGIGQEHYLHRIQAAHCRACEVLIPDVPELLTAHITSLTHKENCKTTFRTIKINSYAVAKELFLDEKILQMLKKYSLKEKPVKEIVACLSQVNSTEDILVSEKDDDDSSDEYAIADPEVPANHNVDSISEAKADREVSGNHNEESIYEAKADPEVPGNHNEDSISEAKADPEVPGNHNEDAIPDAKAHPEAPATHKEHAIADAKAHPEVPGNRNEDVIGVEKVDAKVPIIHKQSPARENKGHPGSIVPCPPMNIPKNMPSSSMVNPQLIPRIKITLPSFQASNRFRVRNDFEFAEDFNLEDAPERLKKIGSTDKKLQQAAEQKNKVYMQSTFKRTIKIKHLPTKTIVKRFQFTCCFCNFRTLYDEEIKRHLQSQFHKEVFHYIEEKFSKLVADFLQEMLYWHKKIEERRGRVEDLNTTIQEINCNQEFAQRLGMENFLEVETTRCVACNKIMAMSTLQQHIKSLSHKQNSRIMMEQFKEAALHLAKTRLTYEETKRKLKQYMQGQNLFLNDEKDNSRNICSTDPAPEAKGSGQVPCCSLANSNQSYKKQVKEEEDAPSGQDIGEENAKEEEDAPSGQDIGEENAEDCDYACEALDYAEVDAPPYKKTKMA
ncbi:uncharacterized protein [Eleutherodactylus coqui]|uniref:uncharacterized protein isoform X2 n=1 Tax=Eleutherodactylus coqui TaxID=57060 RepID=UPI0034633CE4